MNSSFNPPLPPPSEIGEYQVALRPDEASPDARRYWDGRRWSNPYLSSWTEIEKSIVRFQPSELFPFWKPVAPKAEL